MSKLKICNRCHELFDDDSFIQFSPCPLCSGEIIFVDEDEYYTLSSEEEEFDVFLESLVMNGSPSSLREVNVSCSFNTQKAAKQFEEQMNERGYCNFIQVTGCRNEWTVQGSENVKIRELEKRVDEIYNFIQTTKATNKFECISIIFLK